LNKITETFHSLDVLEYLSQFATIFKFLQRQVLVVIHCDVTPDNIVITAEGKIMLIDFGAANELLGTATGTLVDEQRYISHDQFRGHATASSDLYDLAASIFFILTGQDQKPLSKSSPKAMVASIRAATGVE